MKSIILFCTLAIAVTACKDAPSYNNALEYALKSNNPKIKTVLDGSEQHEIQIRYTQIDRVDGDVVFTDHDYGTDANVYFYPASTVKFPAALATLEKLNELDTLDRHTKFYIEGDSIETSFSRAITEIFAVSDNEANNRLVEFLGFDDLNRRIGSRTESSIRIAHRLSTANADDVTTKPLIIYRNDSSTVVSSPIVSRPAEALQLKQIKKGNGFFAGDSLISEPFDFSLKNHYPVVTQHEVLKRVIFPETFELGQRFEISPSQREFLLEAMSALPYQVGYDRKEFYDGYVKFFMFGDSEEHIPEEIKIYNKVGYAYGTLTDCAYIHDQRNDIEFLLTATILVNSDQVFNDDHYEYDEVGIPFLAELGRQIHAYEMTRKK